MSEVNPFSNSGTINWDQAEALPLLQDVNDYRTEFKNNTFAGQEPNFSGYALFHVTNIISILTNTISAVASIFFGLYELVAGEDDPFKYFKGSMLQLGTSLGSLPVIFEVRILASNIFPGLAP